MKLKTIKFENYKAFKSIQEFEIKPITILIGKNSSGKSVVSRLPLLISRSLAGSSSSPLELQFDDLDFGGSFVDLIHNRFSHGFLNFEIVFADSSSEAITLKVQIQNIADYPIQIIKFFSLTSSDGFKLELNWILNEAINEPQFYEATGALTGKHNIDFKGFIPVNIREPNFLKYLTRIKEVPQTINYLGPFRQFPERTYRYTGSTMPQIGYKGKNAPQILGIDYFKDGKIVESVGEWFKENLGGWKLGVEKALNFFELVLVSPDDPSVKVNIVDVGHGMSQVLPIIVRNFIPNGFNNSIEIVEQPELHLHPAAHGNLAELYATTSQRENSSFIIETHSENFILRLRRLVAEGKIKKEDIIIYWIDDLQRPGSELNKIEVDDNGDVNFWPEGIFTESLEEVKGMRRAQREK